MALMPIEERKKIFAAIGYEYSEAGMKKLQKEHMARKSDVDGIYGPDTENTALTIYYTKKYCKNFEPWEFKCECGGKYCCGYPDYMKPEELIHIQAIRSHWNKPITVTSGLRCKRYNSSISGSSSNSGHLYGYAVDFYQQGVTDSVNNRTTAISWIKQQPNHDYTYGNAVYDSNGNYRSCSNMGNALHTETHKGNITPDKPRHDGEVIDISYVQKNIDFAKVKADGIVGAIIRCGFRGYGSGKLVEDEQFMAHIKGAKNAGLKVGVYFFTEAINAAEGKEEAQYAISLVKKSGVKLDYPIAVDTEWINADEFVRANNISKAARTAAIKAFCEEIKSQGYEPMIYASLNWFDTRLDMGQLPYTIWCAQYYDKCQYKGEYAFWQYTSKGNVSGINGVVDLNKNYYKQKPVEQKYTGKIPTIEQIKTPQEVIDDAIKFAKWICGDNTFGYGRKGGADYEGTTEYDITHRGGCHFCGTNSGKINSAKSAGLKNPEEWEYTYVCNTFVHAAYAHAGIPSMLDRDRHAWWIESYQASSYWTEIKKPSKITDLKPGDVLAWDGHFSMYLGNGKGAEATSCGDASSSKSNWANSIRICDFSYNFRHTTHVFRCTRALNYKRHIRYGEVSKRVEYLQAYLNWFGKYGLTVDGEFGKNTLAAVKDYQKKKGLEVDGIVGTYTLAAIASDTK